MVLSLKDKKGIIVKNALQKIFKQRICKFYGVIVVKNFIINKYKIC